MPKQRSVAEDVKAFCGWDFLLELIEAAPSAFMQGLIAGLLGTGGRISEVLALRIENVDPTLHPEVVVVKQMPLLKRSKKLEGEAGRVTKWKCVDHCNKRWSSRPSLAEFGKHNIKEYVGWITKPDKDQRTFPIRVDEPLTPYFTDWWKRRVKAKEDLLFPIKRSAAFVRIRKVGEKLDKDIPFCNIRSPLIYNHWFRAEKACQLAFDYGFYEEDLNSFFGWKKRRPTMAQRYASLGWKGLARRMGVEV